MLTSFDIHRAELKSSLKTFAGKFFLPGEELEIRGRVAIMFKSKSAFVTTGRDTHSDKPEKINISTFLTVDAYEHCETIRHFR